VTKLSGDQYWLDCLKELHQLCISILDGSGSLVEGSRTIPALIDRVGIRGAINDKLFVVIDSETDHLPFGDVLQYWNKEALKKLEPEIAKSEAWAREVGLAEIEKLLTITGRMMFPAVHPDAQTVQAVLGSDFVVVEFLASTKTSADAAAAIGCTVGQIAKSILFKTAKDQKPVLVVTSGGNRIDEKKVSAALSEKVKSADAAFVIANAGVAPGGVAPVGHHVEPIVVLDHDLKLFPEIWAAAGTPNAVFKLTWDDLVSLTKGTPADVRKDTYTPRPRVRGGGAAR
jgi:prolyl-tRNA editing enzyme YbaK/EbsC (Cys-tRNA(Pro) deacylase)